MERFDCAVLLRVADESNNREHITVVSTNNSD